MEKKRVFVIHGWDGVPNDSWKPWLKEELEKRGFEVIAPQMPGGNNPKVKEWLSTLNKIVTQPNKNDYFVGHSLGCISICRYLETIPVKTKVGGCVFVSGFSGNLGIPEISEFYSLPIDFTKVKKHTSNFVMIHSEDDRDVPLAKAKEMQKQVNAKFILEKGMGHISESDGVKELPSLLGSLLEMAK